MQSTPGLAGKKIVLGVCGGIAAYKAVYLLRILKESGADVKVVMTDTATQFVGPVTFSALSGHPVHTVFFDEATGSWHNHVELGLWADALVIAPATSGALARAASGAATDLLTAVYLSARCPVLWCPAMDLDMYAHGAVQNNLATLRSYGNYVLEPADGPLASGLSGKGRLPEPEAIAEELRFVLNQDAAWAGKKVLITAGPTHEAIDPVRFVGNLSSGRMGFAIAREAAARGAHVTLISGPTNQVLPGASSRIKLLPITSAQDMLSACQSVATSQDVFIFSAAVADYRPAELSASKTKKSGADWHLHLVENPDIAATLAANKQTGQRFIGFALEHGQDTAPAAAKLARKHLDAICFNSLDGPAGSPLGAHQNTLSIVFAGGTQTTLPLANKDLLAAHLLEALEPLLT